MMLLRLVLCGASASALRPQPVRSFDPLGLARSRAATAAAPKAAAAVAPKAAAVAAAAAALAPLPALAKGGEFGLCEGRIISLAHPVAMGGCFLATLYAGYTGLQWRRLRTVGVELKDAQRDARDAAAAVAAATTDDAAAPAALVTAQTAADARVSELKATRADIAAGDFRDAHHRMGAVLLAVGIPMALEGPVNTYMRAGKLFPGPHVYAGVGVASLWAIAAACVPEMQKGRDWARNVHVTVNALSVALFAYYQIPTGLEIAQKVIEKTSFP